MINKLHNLNEFHLILQNLQFFSSFLSTKKLVTDKRALFFLNVVKSDIKSKFLYSLRKKLQIKEIKERKSYQIKNWKPFFIRALTIINFLV
jgi:hypothetical protein